MNSNRNNSPASNPPPNAPRRGARNGLWAVIAAAVGQLFKHILDHWWTAGKLRAASHWVLRALLLVVGFDQHPRLLERDRET
jgi:uncharacterized membrane protein YoaK (UPF0700 family)